MLGCGFKIRSFKSIQNWLDGVYNDSAVSITLHSSMEIVEVIRRCQWHCQIWLTGVDNTDEFWLIEFWLSVVSDTAKSSFHSDNNNGRTYQIPDLSVTEPIRYWTLQIPNLSDTKPISYETCQIKPNRYNRYLIASQRFTRSFCQSEMGRGTIGRTYTLECDRRVRDHLRLWGGRGDWGGGQHFPRQFSQGALGGVAAEFWLSTINNTAEFGLSSFNNITVF